jgi:type I restriction enzyme, S subunit
MANGEQQLPKGWIKATIGDIAISMKNGIYKPAEFYADDGIACLRMYNIEDGAIIWKDIKRMKLTKDEIDIYRLLPGDILVNRVNSRELVGKAAIIPDGIETTVYESKNIRLRINRELADSKFINFCFGAFGQHYFNYNAQQVVGMASINQNQIAQMPIPLPPLPEQERIVAKIEELFTQLDAGTSALERVQAGLRRYKASVLKAAVSGRLVNGNLEIGERELPEGWEWKSASEFCVAVESGSTPRADLMTSDGGEVPFIKVYNLTFDGTLDFTIKPTFISSETQNTRLKRSKVHPGDVLTNIVGPPLGKVSIVPDVYPEWNINQAIVLFRVGEAVDNKYLSIVLESPQFQKRLKATSKATAGQFNVSLTTCRTIPMPIPPLEEQRRIVAEVERRLSVARVVETAVEAALVRASRLRQAVLRSAFEGRL